MRIYSTAQGAWIHAPWWRHLAYVTRGGGGAPLVWVNRVQLLVWQVQVRWFLRRRRRR